MHIPKFQQGKFSENNMQVTQEFASHGDRTIEKLSLVTG
jgi:hypothetical protein